MLDIALLVMNDVVSRKYNIVIDFVNHKADVRKRFQQAAKLQNISYNVVFLDTPKEERLRRREGNVVEGDVPGRRIISLLQMDEFEREFEVPSDQEHVIRLTHQSDIDKFLSSVEYQ